MSAPVAKFKIGDKVMSEDGKSGVIQYVMQPAISYYIRFDDATRQTLVEDSLTPAGSGGRRRRSRKTRRSRK